MASLTVELREAAGDGDIASLEVVLSICNTGLRHPNMVSTITDIVTRNLQPDRFPLPPVKLSNGSHRKWMKTLILSFSIFNVTFQSMFGRSQVVPEILRRKLRAHWITHVWPSVRAVIDIAILDDMQTTVDSGNTPERVCTVVCETLEILNWATFGLSQVIPGAGEAITVLEATDGFSECVASLFCRCLDRYTDSLDVDGVYDVIQGRRGGLALEEEPRFIPMLLAKLQELKRKLGDEAAENTLDSLCQVIVKAVGQSLKLIASIRYDYLEIIDVLLSIWRNCLTMVRPSALILSCAAAVGTIVDLGGTITRRRAVRKHYLELILETGRAIVEGPATALIVYLPIMLGNFKPYLIHLSVLTPVLHALDRIKTRQIEPTDHGLHLRTETKRALLKNWKELRDYALDRGEVWKEYRTYSISREPTLCGYKQCPKDLDISARRCGGCKFVYYCSEACQKADRSTHQVKCTYTNHQMRWFHDERDQDFLQYQLNYDLSTLRTYRSGRPDDELGVSYDYMAAPFELAYAPLPQAMFPDGFELPSGSILVLGKFPDAHSGPRSEGVGGGMLIGYVNKGFVPSANGTSPVMQREKGQKVITFFGVRMSGAGRTTVTTPDGKDWLIRTVKEAREAAAQYQAQ